MALSDTKVRNSKPREKAYKISDGKGLFLTISPNGSKYWRFKYYFNNKEKLLALGVYPDVTLAQARDKHLEARRLIANGVDPRIDKQIKKRAKRVAAENSFEAIATGRADRDPANDLRGALPPVKENYHATITEPKAISELLRAIKCSRTANCKTTA